MTKEKLMEWGLTEEQATKVMEGLNGSFVTKTRFNEVNEELKTAKAAVTERDTQLETLRKSGADAAALQDQITQLQAANAAKDQEHAAEIKKIKIDNAVDKALMDAKAINSATVKPLLAAFLEKADLDDDGTIRGLVDEIGKLAKTEDTSFLFKAEDTTTTTISGASPAGSSTVNPTTKAGAYLFLLAEYEVFGTRYGANSAEQNFQQQYEYFQSGNPRVAYNHTAVSPVVSWYLRSPDCGYTDAFRNVTTSGTSSFPDAYRSGGVRPGFTV